MPLATFALVSMPCLLMIVTIVASRRLEAFPGKDDLWELPKPSSLH